MLQSDTNFVRAYVRRKQYDNHSTIGSAPLGIEPNSFMTYLNTTSTRSADYNYTKMFPQEKRLLYCKIMFRLDNNADSNCIAVPLAICCSIPHRRSGKCTHIASQHSHIQNQSNNPPSFPAVPSPQYFQRSRHLPCLRPRVNGSRLNKPRRLLPSPQRSSLLSKSLLNY